MKRFEGFEKIPRLKRSCVITEKIDGTNGSIWIPEPGMEIEADGKPFLVGSRTRWITPEQDNYGFARWAYDHAAELLLLGPGHHFGEWWGAGIQRRYDQKEKRFSLFNTARWATSGLREDGQYGRPACCSVVPVLHEGLFSTDAVESALLLLRAGGSQAAPGFMKPEGVVIYLSAARALFKQTIEKDAEHKGEGR